MELALAVAKLTSTSVVPTEGSQNELITRSQHALRVQHPGRYLS